MIESDSPLTQRVHHFLTGTIRVYVHKGKFLRDKVTGKVVKYILEYSHSERFSSDPSKMFEEIEG